MELEAKGPLGTAALAKLALALLSTIVALGIFTAQASAITLYVHPLLGSFGANGVNSKFHHPVGVAVDQGSHDVYVIDAGMPAGEPNLYRFNSNGEPHAFTAGPGVGTNAMAAGSPVIAPPGSPGGTAGDIYAIVGGKVEIYSSAGAHIGTIDGSGNPNPGTTAVLGVTTDVAGNLYISYARKAPEFPFDHLDKYVPSANPPKNSDFDSELRFEGSNSIGDVAFAPGAFYTPGFRYPLAFPGSGGSAVASPEGPGISSRGLLATDFSNGDIYATVERMYNSGTFPADLGIRQYDAAGKAVSYIVSPGLSGFASDLAVDATSGQLYVPIFEEAGAEQDVRIYGDGEPVQPPTASIDPVTTFDFQSAHFSGTVNPGGSGEAQKTAYRFYCKPGCSGLQFGRTVPSDGADHVVSDDITGLKPETSYEIELVARNVALTPDLENFNNHFIPDAEEPGEVVATTTFETPAKPSAVAPKATIDPVTSFDSTSATLSGTVDPGGTEPIQATKYRFEYTTAADYAANTPQDEQQKLTISATGGTFTLAFGGPKTAPLPFNASAAEVQSALNALPSIGGEGGSVSVSGGPGDAAGSSPYTIAFEGALANRDVDGLAVGSSLSGGSKASTVETTTQGHNHFADATMAPVPDGEVAPSATPVVVSQEIEGLEPNTTYFVRLRAENAGGVAASETDPSFTTDVVAPLVEATEATHVLSGSAQINGRIDPGNSHTTYYFQWGSGDCASSSCTSIPASQDADAGSGPSFVYVNTQLSGLSPNTTYHYRLIAVSPAGEATSQDSSFSTEAPAQPCGSERSGFAATLPDCRAYELVSPVDKRGADVLGWPLRTRSSSDGDAVSYGASTSFGDSAGSTSSGVDYISVRGADGWSAHSLTPFHTPVPQAGAFSSGQFTGDFSADLENGIFRGLTPVPGTGGDNVAGVANLYLASGMRSGTPHFQLLSDATAPVQAVPIETVPHINLGGASADYKHVVFETHDNLTPDASGIGDKAYEWTDGEERLVGILPDDACGAPPCIAPSSAIGAGALISLDFGATTYTNLAHAISADGSRIFFTAGSLPLWSSLGGANAGFAGSLYVRIDGQSTVQIDASERSTPDPKGPGRSEFQRATPDGKTAFFLSREELVDADTDGSGGSLYRYEADAPAGHHLSLVDTAGVTVNHIVAMTPHMEYMYFLGGGSDDDLYVKHGGDVHRIAAGPFKTDLGQAGSNPAGVHWNEARMSADGRRLLFGSDQDQGLYAPYDPELSELYLYDYASDELACVSCSENGTPPTSNASFNGTHDLRIDQGGPAYEPGLYNNTPLPSNGRYVFFSTHDSLVAGDTNGHLDAYSYDVTKGKLSLISSGQCNCDSLFLTASPSGRDVFFTTRQQLVRVDGDNLADVYDARIGGGIASQNAPPPGECQGDACQAPPSSPNDVTPASTSFNGPASPSVKRAHKHKAKKHKRGRRQSHAHKRQKRQRDNGRAGK